MKIIRHRRNTIYELAETPTNYGVEVDIRSQGDALVIHHDPFVAGESFDAWIAAYRHGTLILNVKEEGLEDRLLALMALHGISDFFFLDQSFPFLIRTARKGERRCAVRLSEYESLETALALADMIEWVWVDCFTRFPLERVTARILQNAGFKLCLVSPELQGHGPERIEEFREILASQDIMVEAVCTKLPEKWR
jgi:hypothetical protein